MRLTTKGRYAVTAMLDLALHTESSPVALADISYRQGISLSYLEQLFSLLRKKDLVCSVRGPGGGYHLSRPGEDIFVAHIIDAVDEVLDATGCRGMANCNGGEEGLTHHLWEDLSNQIHKFLSQISLADLVKRNEVKRVVDRQRSGETIKLDIGKLAVS